MSVPLDNSHLPPTRDECNYTHVLSIKLPYAMENTSLEAPSSALAVLNELESRWMKKVPYMDTSAFTPVVVPRPLRARGADDAYAVRFDDRQKGEQLALRAAAQTVANVHALRPVLAVDGPPISSIDFSGCFPYDERPGLPIARENLTNIVDAIRSQCTAPAADPAVGRITIVSGHKGTGKSTLLPPLLLYAFRHLSLQSGCPDAHLCRTVFLVCHSAAACVRTAQQIQLNLADWGVSGTASDAPAPENFTFPQSFALRKPKAHVCVHTEDYVSANIKKIYSDSSDVHVVVCTPGACIGYIENMTVDERSKQTNAALWASSLFVVDDADAATPDVEILLWALRDLKMGSGAPRRYRRIRPPVLLLAHAPCTQSNPRVAQLQAFFTATDPLRGLSNVVVRCDTIALASQFSEEKAVSGATDAPALNVMDLPSEDEDESLPPLLPAGDDPAADGEAASAHPMAAIIEKVPLLERCQLWGSEDIRAALGDGISDEITEKIFQEEISDENLCESFAIPLATHFAAKPDEKGPVLVVLPSDSAVKHFTQKFTAKEFVQLLPITSSGLQQHKEISGKRLIIPTTHAMLRALSRHAHPESFAAVIDTGRVAYDTSLMRTESGLPVVEEDAVTRCTRWVSQQELAVLAEFVAPISEKSENLEKPIVVTALPVSTEMTEVASTPIIPRPLLPQVVLRVLTHLTKTRNDLTNGLALRQHPISNIHSALQVFPFMPAPTSFAVSAALAALHYQGILCIYPKAPARADDETVENIFGADSSTPLSISATGAVVAGLASALPLQAVYTRLAVAKLLCSGVAHRCPVSAATTAALLILGESEFLANIAGEQFSDFTTKSVFWQNIFKNLMQEATADLQAAYCASVGIEIAFGMEFMRLSLSLLRLLSEMDVMQHSKKLSEVIEGTPAAAFTSEALLPVFNSHIIAFDFSDSKTFEIVENISSDCPVAVHSDPSDATPMHSVQHIAALLAASSAESPADASVIQHILVLAMYPNVCQVRCRGASVKFLAISGDQLYFQQPPVDVALPVHKKEIPFPRQLPSDGTLFVFSHRRKLSQMCANFTSLQNVTAAAPLSLILAASNMTSAEAPVFTRIERLVPAQCAAVPMHRGWYAEPGDLCEESEKVHGTITSHGYAEAQQSLYPRMQHILTLDGLTRIIAGDKHVANTMMLLHLMQQAVAHDRVCAHLEIAPVATEKPIDRAALAEVYRHAIGELLSEKAQQPPVQTGVPTDSLIVKDPFEAFLDATQGRPPANSHNSGAELLVYSVRVGTLTPSSYHTIDASSEFQGVPRTELPGAVAALQKALPYLSVLHRSVLQLMDKAAVYLQNLEKRADGAPFFERVADDKAFAFLKRSSAVSPAVHRFYSFLYQKRLEASILAERRRLLEKKAPENLEYAPAQHILIAHALTKQTKTKTAENPNPSEKMFGLDEPELNTVLRFCDAAFTYKIFPSLYTARKRFLPAVHEGYILTEEGDERKKTNAMVSAGLLKLTPEIRAAFEGESKERRDAAVSKNLTETKQEEERSRDRVYESREARDMRHFDDERSRRRDREEEDRHRDEERSRRRERDREFEEKERHRSGRDREEDTSRSRRHAHSREEADRGRDRDRERRRERGRDEKDRDRRRREYDDHYAKDDRRSRRRHEERSDRHRR